MDNTKVYRAVPPGEMADRVRTSKARLQKILAFYLYARKHPLPIMGNCMWGDNLDDCFRTRGGNGDHGDFQLEYVRLLWGDEKLDKRLEKVIKDLQALRDLPGDYDPNATPQNEDNENGTV